MKIRTLFFLILVWFISCPLYAEMKLDPDLAKVLPAQVKGAKLMFVILSRSASIKIKNQQQQTYQLTLKQVNPNIIYFADRPARLSGEFDLSQFITQWYKGPFQKQPPNAVMVAFRLDEVVASSTKRVNYAIVLRNPSYDAKENQLMFEISSLPGNKFALPNLAHSNYVALFVDPCVGCVGF